jgi:hypothetical protein
MQCACFLIAVKIQRRPLSGCQWYSGIAAVGKSLVLRPFDLIWVAVLSSSSETD